MPKALVVGTLLFGIAGLYGCHHDGAAGGDAGEDAAVAIDGDGGGGDGGGASCLPAGQACAAGGDCCSGACTNNLCAAGLCGDVGAACTAAADCCTLNCGAGGTCLAVQCLSDGQACAAGGAPCCSTQCVDGSCAPLNPQCKTAGNACAADGECCAGHCTNGLCAPPSSISFCTQVGDICAHDTDCCTGVCEIAAGATAGTCAQITTSCSLDGTLCNGCGTTPRCCSGFCAPYGASGASVCQPASGCHVLGDLCHTNIDCCGGDAASGLPGAGLVMCVPDPKYGNKIGTCSQANPNYCPNNEPTCKNTCQPEGDVCHFQGVGGCSSNSFPANCCGEPGQSSGVCKLDALGVPRCYGLTQCVAAGGACASAADCCDGVPCVPDTNGQLHCGAAACVQKGGVCTTTADCCTGYACDVPPGSLTGTCTNVSLPPPDAGTPTDGSPAPACALFGQSCSTSVACCAGQGDCLRPYGASSAPCAAGDTDCTCYGVIQ